MICRIKFILLVILAFQASLCKAVPCAGLLTKERPEYEKLRELLANPEISQAPFPMHLKPAQDLVDIMAGFVPVTYAARRALASQLFNWPMKVTGAGKHFAYELAKVLADADLLDKKSANGEFLLINALMTTDAPGPRVALSEELRAEVTALLGLPEADVAPLDYSNPSIQRLQTILAQRITANPEERAALITQVLGLALANGIDFNDEGFVHNLMRLMSGSDTLTGKAADGKYLFLNLLE